MRDQLTAIASFHLSWIGQLPQPDVYWLTMTFKSSICVCWVSKMRSATQIPNRVTILRYLSSTQRSIYYQSLAGVVEAILLALYTCNRNVNVSFFTLGLLQACLYTVLSISPIFHPLIGLLGLQIMARNKVFYFYGFVLQFHHVIYQHLEFCL